MTKDKSRLWRCPNCGRDFVKRNQAHSCKRQSIESHFEFRDSRLSDVFELLLSRLRELGPLRIDAVESSINLISRYHFGGVKVQKDHLTIGFLSSRMISDKRIHRVEKVAPQKFVHFVKVRAANDIDNKLITWLAKAYHLQA